MLPQNRRGVWRWMELTTSLILPWWRGKFTSLKHKLLSEIVRSSESDSEVWTISRNIIAETILRRICSWPFWTGSLPSFWKKNITTTTSHTANAKGQVACDLVEDYLPNGTSLGLVQPSVKCAASHDQCPCQGAQWWWTKIRWVMEISWKWEKLTMIGGYMRV